MASGVSASLARGGENKKNERLVYCVWDPMVVVVVTNTHTHAHTNHELFERKDNLCIGNTQNKESICSISFTRRR